MTARPRSLREWAALAAGIVLILGEALPLAYGPLLSAAVVGVSTDSATGGRLVRAVIEVRSGPQPLRATALLFPMANVSEAGPVVFYEDPKYPIIGDPTSVYGVWDHLMPALRDRGYAGGAEVANASQLAGLMNSSLTPVVVMTTSVMPDLILNRTRNLVRPFLARGGILVWAGHLLGAYTAGTNETEVNWDQAWNLRWDGETAVFGAPLIGVNMTFPGTVNRTTAVSAWLDIRYPYAYVGANLSYLAGQGGFALGGVSDGTKDNVSFPHTSVAWIPVGRGGVVLFGYAPVLPYGYSAEDIVANDIAQVLQSGILRWDLSVDPDVVNLTLDRGATLRVALSAFLPDGDPAIMAYVYTRGPLPTSGFDFLLRP